MEKTHWKKLDNPDFIGAYAFQPGEEKTLTVSTVSVEEITGADGKKENCTVIHWAESSNKPLILNTTNAKMITKMLQTPYIEDWAGRAVVLGVEIVSAFGEKVEAVRVKKKQAATASPCMDCGQIITASGKFTAVQIASASKNAYGKTLCLDCAKSAKAAREASDASE